MRQFITEADAQEAGVPLAVYQMWIDVMQALWEASIYHFNQSKNEQLFPTQLENTIHLGKQFTITAHMCNNAFVEAELYEGEKLLAQLRYEGNVNTICQCFFIIITDKAL